MGRIQAIEQPEGPVLLTITQVAEYLGKTERTIYRLMERGLLEVVSKRQRRRRVLVTLESVEAYKLAGSMSIPQMLKRMLQLEHKVALLQSSQKKSDKTQGSYEKREALLRLHHPEVFG